MLKTKTLQSLVVHRVAGMLITMPDKKKTKTSLRGVVGGVVFFGWLVAWLVRWAVLALCSLRSVPPCSGYALLRRAAGSAGRGDSGLPERWALHQCQGSRLAMMLYPSWFNDTIFLYFSLIFLL